jgi:V/A-type H+-transporting ATPase subunit C
LLSPKYAFISAYLKGEEAKSVTSDQMDRMLKASDFQAAFEIIRETDVGSYFEELNIKTFDDVDEHLWKYFMHCVNYVELFKFLPGDVLKVSRAYIVKYDVLNTKAALQSISTGKESRMIPVGVIYRKGFLDELSAAANIKDIIELLVKCELGNFVDVLTEYEVDGRAKSKLLLEAKLDGEYYKALLNMARSIKDGSVLSTAIGTIIDLANLQIASRAIIGGIGSDAAEAIIPAGYIIGDKTIRELLSLNLTDMPHRLEGTQYRHVAEEILASYEQTTSITAIEEVINKYKFRLLKEILSPRVLSPLVMAWYLILKEFEIRNLRLILKAIADDIPPEEIKEYLVS